MSFTLKIKNKKSPLFLQKDNSFDINPTRSFVEFESLNQMAQEILDKKYFISPAVFDKTVVSKSDMLSLFNENKLANLSSLQDFSHSLKLIDISNERTITKKQAARLYCDKFLELSDPIIDSLVLIQLPLQNSDSINNGDKLMYCSDYSSQIFFHSPVRTVIARVDPLKLYENHNIDPEKFSFFIVS